MRVREGGEVFFLKELRPHKMKSEGDTRNFLSTKGREIKREERDLDEQRGR